MRGAAFALPRIGMTRRIIPARAGSSESRKQRRECGEDHPRACGEQPVALLESHHVSGSSPRVRGADLRVLGALVKRRIIPARAGSSGTVNVCVVLVGDHPRACGEQFFSGTPGQIVGGSSPRVRGAVSRDARVPAPVRIIPARAGSSERRSWRDRGRWDHPRACGEQPTQTSRRS